MRAAESCRGFSLLEALVALMLTALTVASVGGMLVDNAKLNSSQQLQTRIQCDARTGVSMIVQRIRSAGWDPRNAGVQMLVLDPLDIDADHTDGVDNLIVFTDRNGDGETDGTVTDVHVTQPSGVALLDMAAQRAILNAAPFGPLPREYGTNRKTIEALFPPPDA